MSGGFFLITAAEEGSIVVLEATMVRSEVSMHAGGGVKEGEDCTVRRAPRAATASASVLSDARKRSPTCQGGFSAGASEADTTGPHSSFTDTGCQGQAG